MRIPLIIQDNHTEFRCLNEFFNLTHNNILSLCVYFGKNRIKMQTIIQKDFLILCRISKTIRMNFRIYIESSERIRTEYYKTRMVLL